MQMQMQMPKYGTTTTKSRWTQFRWP